MMTQVELGITLFGGLILLLAAYRKDLLAPFGGAWFHLDSCAPNADRFDRLCRIYGKGDPVRLIAFSLNLFLKTKRLKIKGRAIIDLASKQEVSFEKEGLFLALFISEHDTDSIDFCLYPWQMRSLRSLCATYGYKRPEHLMRDALLALDGFHRYCREKENEVEESILPTSA